MYQNFLSDCFINQLTLEVTMSQQLRKVYDASYRKRKKGDEVTVAPADAAERMRRYRLRKRIAEADPASGEEVPGEPGPSVSNRAKRRRVEAVGEDVPDAPRSKAAERMKRYRKRKQPSGRSESGGADEEDATSERRHRTGGRGRGTGSGSNRALESLVQGKCSEKCLSYFCRLCKIIKTAYI